jgi:hypothetical protein
VFGLSPAAFLGEQMRDHFRNGTRGRDCSHWSIGI